MDLAIQYRLVAVFLIKDMAANVGARRVQYQLTELITHGGFNGDVPHVINAINRDRLKLMKTSAFLINTSRGGLVVEADLADALNQQGIAGAALDVLTLEPPPADNPLLTARNCLITPHIAWATREARTKLMTIAIENLKAFLKGQPVNVVNQ